MQVIDLDGLEEWNVIKNYLKSAKDMSAAPATYQSISGKTVTTTYNLHGWPSNNLYLWNKVVTDHPNFLDPWNNNRVLVDGYSPIYTRDLKAHWESIG